MKPYLTLARAPVLTVLMIAAVVVLPGNAWAQGCRGAATTVFQPYRWNPTMSPGIGYRPFANAWQFQPGVPWTVTHNPQWYPRQYGYPGFGPIAGFHGSYAFPYVYSYGYGHGYARPYMRPIPHFPRLLFRSHR